MQSYENNDFLGGSTILRQARIPREIFDARNEKHLISARAWLDTGNWKDVQFYPVAPCITVTETVLRCLAEAALHDAGFKSKRENVSSKLNMG